MKTIFLVRLPAYSFLRLPDAVKFSLYQNILPDDQLHYKVCDWHLFLPDEFLNLAALDALSLHKHIIQLLEVFLPDLRYHVIGTVNHAHVRRFVAMQIRNFLFLFFG